MKNLDDLRVEIDKIDDEIVKLLSKRMEFVKKIGDLKNSAGAPVYRPKREKDIINRLISKKGKLLSKKAIESIYYEIFSISRNIEKPQVVAFLGPIGTYSHQAAKSRFGAISSYLPLLSIDAVFKELVNKSAKYGVVPIENNTEGAVGATLDCLARFKEVKIVAEIYMDIHHSFVSDCEKISEIKTIFSHPQGYNQCLKFLEDHGLSDCEFIATKSTAMAAQRASNTPNSAAICSQIAANIYQVPVMFDKIEDNLANRTRFLILSDFKNQKTDNDKTSIMAQTDHKAGSLARLLQAFKDNNINLTKLESRPIKQKDFVSRFFIDFQGHIDDENVGQAFADAKHSGCEIEWLGSYMNGDE